MKRPLNSNQFPSIKDNPNPWGGLVTSLHEEHNYRCEIEGRVPPEISGVLYRLGPGLYDRGADRKRMVLDGDGMMQSFQFDQGVVEYRNRYVRTKKYLAEEKAGRFVCPTLSTHSSGSWFENLGIVLPHQANITALCWGGRLLAFDESQKPYELTLDSLETLNEVDLDQTQPKLRYWAHWKLDATTQQVHYIAIEQGPVLTAHIVSMDSNFKIVARRKVKLPRASYFHDWFLTSDYFGFVLHPAIVSLKTLLKVGMGIETFSDALKWQPEKGNLVFLINRQTGQTHTIEAPSCWMWHSVNAYQEQDQVIMDFIGSEEGGGLGDPHSPLFEIMKNKDLEMPEKTINHLRRYRIDPAKNKLVYETLASHGNFELPTVGALSRGLKHSYSHFIYARPKEFFARGLGEWDQSKDQLNTFSSQTHEYFSEPLSFESLGGPSSDWLSSLVYDGDRQKSYLGIFRVGQVSEGPVAKVWLRHHSPLGFHGYWQAR